MKETTVPRPEYPRPQFVRPDWLCLNGEWQFEIDSGDSGLERGLVTREKLAQKITVPFCPESELSGIGNTDFMRVVWYRRVVTIPAEWSADCRVLLHFQAVDYDATVWVNGTEVGRHRGGYTPFTCDLHGIARAGEEIAIVARARDLPEIVKPRGKQCGSYANRGCDYTRTTGIWQTVWLEPVPRSYLKRARITPDVAGSRFRIEQAIAGDRAGMRVRATLSDAVGEVAVVETSTESDFTPQLDVVVSPERRRLWSPRDPHLYGLRMELLDAVGAVLDAVESYAGLRGIAIDGKRVLINGESIFQRLVLDQGYYADGIQTAPSDAALERDIDLALAAGFNGARLHQKVFEERFLHHCDRKGYLVWGEFADWGCNTLGRADDQQKPGASYIGEWLEAVERDYSHPAIIGWCPLNESMQQVQDRITQLDDVTRAMFFATKAFDLTRPVIDASGYSHRVAETDIYDSHDYEQDPEKFRGFFKGLAEEKPFVNPHPDPAGPHKNKTWNLPYRGQPYFVSEFGGIWWNPKAKPGEDSWGYGSRVRSEEEFYARFEGLCAALLEDPKMFGYCYTQLTDVFQEQNGIYGFDRSVKFDMERIRRAQERPAAIEG